MLTIKNQFNEMLARGTMPLFEFELNGGDFLLVDLSVNNNGIVFSFDTNQLDTSFKADIIKLSDNSFLMPYDDFFDSLDSYLDMIHENIIEGFLIPTNLFKWDC
tara:strand:- start:2546 stop:2857 length:312 start_codon:yes stop_codon:yes gene_type:complete